MFPPGASGNFLANWLTPDEKCLMPPNYMIDSVDNTNPYRKVLYLGQGYHSQPWSFFNGIVPNLNKVDKNSKYWLRFLSSVNDIKLSSANQIIITHVLDEATIKKHIGHAIYITIWPYSNVFGYIRSTINKSILFNMTETERSSINLDRLLCMIEYTVIDWVKNKNYDLANTMVIDYGNLYKIDHLKKLYLDILGESPSLYRIEWAEKYISTQGKPITDTEISDYDLLKQQIDPTSLTDLAILLYLHEKNNPKMKRCWTIDDVPTDFKSAADFLYKNRHNYYCP